MCTFARSILAIECIVIYTMHFKTFFVDCFQSFWLLVFVFCHVKKWIHSPNPHWTMRIHNYTQTYCACWQCQLGIMTENATFSVSNPNGFLIVSKLFQNGNIVIKYSCDCLKLIQILENILLYPYQNIRILNCGKVIKFWMTVCEYQQPNGKINECVQANGQWNKWYYHMPFAIDGMKNRNQSINE